MKQREQALLFLRKAAQENRFWMPSSNPTV
jgi:hypothetical protein